MKDCLSFIKSIIDSTMDFETRRWNAHPDYGWLDLKANAITGSDFFDDPSFRGKDHVYSWIQGRGLEALVRHILWYESCGFTETPDLGVLRSMADTVARNLERAREMGNGHLYFCMDSSGVCFDSHCGSGRYTMSDLFCSRGLYAYNAAFGTHEDLDKSEKYLRGTLSAILCGNFYNDQKTFEGGQFRTYSDGRVSYAGHMLALGAVVLLMELGSDSSAFDLGRSLVDHIFENHINTETEGSLKWPCLEANTVVEWILEGRPARNGSAIALDSGHALELVGLASQFLDVSHRICNLDPQSHEWTARIERALPEILKTNFNIGYCSPFGIAKSTDALSGKPLDSSMPWWSLPETMRAVCLTQRLTGSDSWLSQTFEQCLESFVAYFVKSSALGTAVQTIGADGKPVPIIPATPDLDPGYHTGLSLISCYEAMKSEK